LREDNVQRKQHSSQHGRRRAAGCTRIVPAIAACLLGFASAAALAQAYPNKALRLIVRAPPGGTDDLIARLIATPISKTVGQQVIVDYRPGAGGLVAWEYVAKQPPDGYTVLLAASGLAAIRSLRPDMPVDPWRDFAWVTQVTSFMLVFTAHPSLPVRSQKDLVALAKSRPGQMSYGSSGVGATPHLAFEYFKAMAKVDIHHVPYKGAGPMYLDLLSGRIEVGTSVLGSAIPHIRSGKLRALGVTGSKRSSQLAEVPTVAEGGLAGFAFEPMYALVVASGTPREIVTALSGAGGRAMAPPEARDQFLRIVGSDVATTTPDQILQIAKREAELIDRVVRTAGIKGGD